MVQDLLRPCPQCQIKKPIPKYDKIPPSLFSTMPWESIQVNLSGPWNFTSSLGTEETINAASNIDIATHRPELHAYNNETSEITSGIFDQE